MISHLALTAHMIGSKGFVVPMSKDGRFKIVYFKEGSYVSQTTSAEMNGSANSLPRLFTYITMNGRMCNGQYGEINPAF